MRITLLKIFIQILILLAVAGCIIPQSWLVNDPIDDHFHPGINVDTQVEHFSPVANNDAATIDYETPTIINVVANDTDPQSSTFTVVSNTAATSGALVDNGDGTITYTPNANFSGTDSFTYTIQNSFGLGATATVNLTVLSYCATFTQIAAVPFTGAPKAYAPLPDGTAPKPYLLCTKAQLDTIAADNTLWDTENYKLMQDIDMDNGGANNGIIGTTANNFTGVFDGNNFTLSNFRYVNNAISEIGFLGNVGAAAQVKNVTVTTGGYFVEGNSYIGILAGRDNGATYSNCHASGSLNLTVAGTYSGGIIGDLKGALSDCSSQVTITSTAAALRNGGVVGRSNAGATISNCTSTGTITTAVGSIYSGGLVGENSGTIQNSSASMNIIAQAQTNGGLVGYNTSTGTITQSISTGSLTASAGGGHGGLVGSNGGWITESYSYNNVNGPGQSVGGLVGNNTGTITSCNVRNLTINNSGWVGGIAGYNSMTVRKSSFTGRVVATAAGIIGGAVGNNTGFVRETSTSAQITGNFNDVSLLVGVNTGTITSSFVTSGSYTISGRYPGALAGYNSGHIVDSWTQLDLDTTGITNDAHTVGRVGAGSVIERVFSIGSSSTSAGMINALSAGIARHNVSLIDIHGSVGGESGFYRSSSLVAGVLDYENVNIGNVYSSGNEASGYAGNMSGTETSLRNISFGDVTSDGARAGGYIGNMGGAGLIGFSEAYGNVFGGDSVRRICWPCLEYQCFIQ